MALIEKLNQIKSETDALLAYANGTTGDADTRLGDAIKTLCDGYGQGGGYDTFLVRELAAVKDDTSTELVVPNVIPAGMTLGNVLELYLIRSGFATETYTTAWAGIGYNMAINRSFLSKNPTIAVNVTRADGSINYYDSGVTAVESNGSIVFNNSRGASLNPGTYKGFVVITPVQFPKGV